MKIRLDAIIGVAVPIIILISILEVYGLTKVSVVTTAIVLLCLFAVFIVIHYSDRIENMEVEMEVESKLPLHEVVAKLRLSTESSTSVRILQTLRRRIHENKQVWYIRYLLLSPKHNHM